MRKGKKLEHFPNLVAMFLDRVEQRGDGPFLWAKHDGSWQAISYNEAARQVAALSDEAHVMTIAVRPEKRRRGHARTLIQAALAVPVAGGRGGCRSRTRRRPRS